MRTCARCGPWPPIICFHYPLPYIYIFISRTKYYTYTPTYCISKSPIISHRYLCCIYLYTHILHYQSQGALQITYKNDLFYYPSLTNFSRYKLKKNSKLYTPMATAADKETSKLNFIVQQKAIKQHASWITTFLL